jgi:hypothetical protein
MYSSVNVIRVITAMIMGWTVYVKCVAEMWMDLK